jgi:hypothetical protein
MAQKKKSKKQTKNEMTRSQKVMAVIGILIILAMILPLVLR